MASSCGESPGRLTCRNGPQISFRNATSQRPWPSAHLSKKKVHERCPCCRSLYFLLSSSKVETLHRPRPRPRCRRAGCSHRTGFTAEGAQTPVRRPSTFAVLVHAKRPRIERGQPNLNPLEHHDRDAARGPHSRRAQGTRTAALDYGQVTSTRIPPSLDGPSAVRVKPLSTSVNDSPTVRVASAILPGLPKV